MKKNRMKNALVCGMLGCLCYGGGDWLMLYGNPAHHGTLLWLTEGVAKIAQWRFNLAMALAFPGILLYGIALFALQGFITGERQRKVYHYLNAWLEASLQFQSDTLDRAAPVLHHDPDAVCLAEPQRLCR